jgi:hypothetical protein
MVQPITVGLDIARVHLSGLILRQTMSALS